MSCIAKYRQEIEFDAYIKKWIDGEVSGSIGKGGYKIINRVRKYLLIKNNYKCSQCGWGEINPYSGKVPLEVDHIDGDWKNNRPENLRIICPNCHSLTKTFRALNSGKGRGSEMRGSRLYRKHIDKNEKV
jgi:rubredoxin